VGRLRGEHICSGGVTGKEGWRRYAEVTAVLGRRRSTVEGRQDEYYLDIPDEYYLDIPERQGRQRRAC
jgi:hypothetical protein